MQRVSEALHGNIISMYIRLIELPCLSHSVTSEHARQMQPLKFDALQQNTADFAFGTSIIFTASITFTSINGPNEGLSLFYRL
jgi:hypothetical protein